MRPKPTIFGYLLSDVQQTETVANSCRAIVHANQLQIACWTAEFAHFGHRKQIHRGYGLLCNHFVYHGCLDTVFGH